MGGGAHPTLWVDHSDCRLCNRECCTPSPWLLVFTVIFAALTLQSLAHCAYAKWVTSTMSVQQAKMKGLWMFLKTHFNLCLICLVHCWNTLRYGLCLDSGGCEVSLLLLMFPYVMETYTVMTLSFQWIGMIKYPLEARNRSVLDRWKVLPMLTAALFCGGILVVQGAHVGVKVGNIVVMIAAIGMSLLEVGLGIGFEISARLMLKSLRASQPRYPYGKLADLDMPWRLWIREKMGKGLYFRIAVMRLIIFPCKLFQASLWIVAGVSIWTGYSEGISAAYVLLLVEHMVLILTFYYLYVYTLKTYSYYRYRAKRHHTEGSVLSGHKRYENSVLSSMGMNPRLNSPLPHGGRGDKALIMFSTPRTSGGHDLNEDGPEENGHVLHRIGSKYSPRSPLTSASLHDRSLLLASTSPVSVAGRSILDPGATPLASPDPPYRVVEGETPLPLEQERPRNTDPPLQGASMQPPSSPVDIRRSQSLPSVPLENGKKAVKLPQTGLCDSPNILRLRRLVDNSPTQQWRRLLGSFRSNGHATPSAIEVQEYERSPGCSPQLLRTGLSRSPQLLSRGLAHSPQLRRTRLQGTGNGSPDLLSRHLVDNSSSQQWHLQRKGNEDLMSIIQRKGNDDLMSLHVKRNFTRASSLDSVPTPSEPATETRPSEPAAETRLEHRKRYPHARSVDMSVSYTMLDSVRSSSTQTIQTVHSHPVDSVTRSAHSRSADFTDSFHTSVKPSATRSSLPTASIHTPLDHSNRSASVPESNRSSVPTQSTSLITPISPVERSRTLTTTRSSVHTASISLNAAISPFPSDRSRSATANAATSPSPLASNRSSLATASSSTTSALPVSKDELPQSIKMKRSVSLGALRKSINFGTSRGKSVSDPIPNPKQDPFLAQPRFSSSPLHLSRSLSRRHSDGKAEIERFPPLRPFSMSSPGPSRRSLQNSPIKNSPTMRPQPVSFRNSSHSSSPKITPMSAPSHARQPPIIGLSTPTHASHARVSPTHSTQHSRQPSRTLHALPPLQREATSPPLMRGSINHLLQSTEDLADLSPTSPPSLEVAPLSIERPRVSSTSPQNSTYRPLPLVSVSHDELSSRNYYNTCETQAGLTRHHTLPMRLDASIRPYFEPGVDSALVIPAPEP
eukprot:g83006.t1